MILGPCCTPDALQQRYPALQAAYKLPQLTVSMYRTHYPINSTVVPQY